MAHDVVASLEARYEYSIGSTLVGDLLGLNEEFSDDPNTPSASLQRSEATQSDGGSSDCSPCSLSGGSQTVDDAPVPSVGGYDGGTTVGFAGVWAEANFCALRSALDKARTLPEGQRVVEFGAGEPWDVFPHGAGAGANGGIFYRWVVEREGTKIYFHESPVAIPGVQAVRVRYGAIHLAKVGLYAAHEEIVDLLTGLGFSIETETLSRADLHVTCGGMTVDEIVRLIFTDHFTARARKDAFHRGGGGARKFTGYELGRGIRLRIYDKFQEIKDNRNEVALAVLTDMFGGSLPEEMTRIEYQLPREVLKEMDIDTVSDLRDSEVSLVEYLTAQWFRLLSAPRSETGNTSRQSLHPLWEKVRVAFQRFFDGTGKSISRASGKISCDADDLIAQAAGCLASALAQSEGIVSDGRLFLELVSDRLKERIAKILHRNVERAERFARSIGVDVADIVRRSRNVPIVS
ncbi:MAG: hypothetical protein ACRC46_15340 [Thermoguttaceae bacterium]